MVSALLKELCFRVSFAAAETMTSQMLPSRLGPPIPFSWDTPETTRVRTPASMVPGWNHHNSTLKMGRPESHHLWQGHWHSQGIPVNSARARTSQWLHLGARAGKKGQGPCRYHRVTELGDRFMSVYEASGTSQTIWERFTGDWSFCRISKARNLSYYDWCGPS